MRELPPPLTPVTRRDRLIAIVMSCVAAAAAVVAVYLALTEP